MPIPSLLLLHRPFPPAGTLGQRRGTLQKRRRQKTTTTPGKKSTPSRSPNQTRKRPSPARAKKPPPKREREKSSRLSACIPLRTASATAKINTTEYFPYAKGICQGITSPRKTPKASPRELTQIINRPPSRLPLIPLRTHVCARTRPLSCPAGCANLLSPAGHGQKPDPPDRPG